MHHGKFLTLKKVMNFPDFLAKFLNFLTIPDIPDIPEKMTTWCLKGNKRPKRIDIIVENFDFSFAYFVIPFSLLESPPIFVPLPSFF